MGPLARAVRKSSGLNIEALSAFRRAGLGFELSEGALAKCPYGGTRSTLPTPHLPPSGAKRSTHPGP
jgi:hypothetical protein